jgi:hypothetical protein
LNNTDTFRRWKVKSTSVFPLPVIIPPLLHLWFVAGTKGHSAKGHLLSICCTITKPDISSSPCVTFLIILPMKRLTVSLHSPRREVIVVELRSSCAHAGPGPWMDVNDQHHAPADLSTGKNSRAH